MVGSQASFRVDRLKEIRTVHHCASVWFHSRHILHLENPGTAIFVDTTTLIKPRGDSIAFSLSPEYFFPVL